MGHRCWPPNSFWLLRTDMMKLANFVVKYNTPRGTRQRHSCLQAHPTCSSKSHPVAPPHQCHFEAMLVSIRGRKAARQSPQSSSAFWRISAHCMRSRASANHGQIRIYGRLAMDGNDVPIVMTETEIFNWLKRHWSTKKAALSTAAQPPTTPPGKNPGKAKNPGFS